MLRTAKDCLKIKEEKLNIFNESQEEIKDQMKLIESKVMNEFFESWNYLNNLDCVYYDDMNRFDLCFCLEVVKVNPDTMAIDNNSSKNTKTQVWLEFGEAVWDDTFKCVMGTHNINLDCGADTFEEAIIKLAKLCKENGLKERY